jgi:hypothetical protein
MQAVRLANLDVLVEGDEEAVNVAGQHGLVGAPDDSFVCDGI